jgi:phage terminase large subunit
MSDTLTSDSPIVRVPHMWRPRSYQMDAWCYFEGDEEGKRGCEVWHRRAGKDLFAINLVATKSQERVGLYWHMLPTYKQGRAIVWNGSTRDGRSFLSHFPGADNPGGNGIVESKNSTEMRITFKNGSHYQVVGTDDINSLVGTNPIGVIFSEYSLHDPAAWEFIRPILAENGGWALFIYTARGRNHGYTLYEMARRNPKWHCAKLVAGSGPECTKRPNGLPVISDEVIEEERKSGMPEAMIEQEFKCSFEAPFVGSYYGAQMLAADKTNRILDNIPHEPRLEVHTAWDLGVDDTTVIWFFQILGSEIRIIDHYENSGEGLPHYAKVLRGQHEGGHHRAEYLYGRHHAPHDIEVRELSSGVSRKKAAKDMGIKFTVCKRHEVVDGIEAVRSLLSRCYFNRKLCQRGIDAMCAYRKEWDDKRKCFKDSPLHDWSSNSADGFRILAMGLGVDRGIGKNQQKPQETAIDEHKYI